MPLAQRVLHVFGSLDRGGAESMIMSLYRNIDRSKFQFDFAVNDSGSEYAYEQEVQQLGGRVYRLPVLSFKNLKKYNAAWSELLSNHPEWKVVHIHHTSTATVSISVARKAGRTTIAHSHTAGSDGSLKSRLKIASRYPVRHLANYLLACSAPAAQWMFGRKSKDTIVLNNAIGVESFLPDEMVRERVRAAMGFSYDQKVIGHVGRFVEEKNHTFMLDVLQALVKKNPEVTMLLVGDGPLKERVRIKAEKIGVINHIVFAGARSDISDLMQAMDVFFFPSLFEGLGVAAIEAQASGLKCVVSASIPSEVRVTDNLEFMSLEMPAEVWAEKLLEYASGYDRKNTYQMIVDAGYDVKDNAKWLENFYHKIMESA